MSIVRTLRFIADHPLNRRHRAGALLRFVKWQLASRLANGAVVYEWIEGAKVLVRNGEAGVTGNIYTGLHEFPDMAFLLHLLTDADRFADVGANVGSYTILASAVRGARSVAFEPVPSTYERLVENIRINHMEDRVDAIQSGVGDAPGTLHFTLGQDAANHVAEEARADTMAVKVQTLDDALGEQAPTLMKIDVEGYETPALRGATATLAKPALKALIIELIGSGSRYGYDEGDIVRQLAELGFEPYAYAPFSRSLTRLPGKNTESGNTIFIRDLDFVQRRLRAAPPVSIFGQRV